MIAISYLYCWYNNVMNDIKYYYYDVLYYRCVFPNDAIILLCSHCAITHKPWVWRALQLLSESVLGTSSYKWKNEVAIIILLYTMHETSVAAW